MHLGLKLEQVREQVLDTLEQNTGHSSKPEPPSSEPEAGTDEDYSTEELERRSRELFREIVREIAGNRPQMDIHHTESGSFASDTDATSVIGSALRRLAHAISQEEGVGVDFTVVPQSLTAEMRRFIGEEFLAQKEQGNSSGDGA